MSKKKSKSQRNRERYEKWINQFQIIGVNSEDELADIIYMDEDCHNLKDETVENGFPYECVYDASYASNTFPETIRISEYMGKYIVWVSGCVVDGYGEDPPLEDHTMIFDTLEEARKYRDEMPKGEKLLKEQIHECKELLNDSRYWIKAESGGWPGQFNSK